VEEALDLPVSRRLDALLRLLERTRPLAQPAVEAVGDVDEDTFDGDGRTDVVRSRMRSATGEDEWAEFLRALNRHAVDYVVVGGIAVLRLVPYRTTNDLDVFVRPDAGNGERLKAALEESFATKIDESAAELVSGAVFRFGGLVHIDVHGRLPGTTWDDVSAHRETAAYRDVPAPFADLDRLIDMKSAVDRPKDRMDLVRLRKLRDRVQR
jgi:hypothetical protein